MLKKAGVGLAARSGWFALRRWLGRGRLRVVTYHGVDDKDHDVINGDRLQTNPDIFKRQMECIARAFRIISPRDAVQEFMRRGAWPDRALAITFDDGYRNNLEIAAPILKCMGIPATFFVTRDFVEQRANPWWYRLRQALAGRGMPPEQAWMEAIRLEAMMRPMTEREREAELERLGVEPAGECFYPFMTPDDCRQLIAQGFDVQCHGVTHASFAAESDETLEREIGRSVEFVKSLGVKPWALAYPYGHEPKDKATARKMMESHGLVTALSTREGANGRGADVWRLRRWDMHGGYSPLAALARVS